MTCSRSWVTRPIASFGLSARCYRRCAPRASGGRTVAGDPGSYLQLFASANLLDRPQSHETISIRIDSPMPNPWTEEPLLRYYPEENIVQLSPGSFVQLEPDLAADVEAARELGADGRGVPWVAVAGAVVLVALAAVVAAMRPRRRLIGARAASRQEPLSP